MNTPKIIGILLIVVGALGLAYGGVSYMDGAFSAELIVLQDKDPVYVLIAVSAAALALGVLLLIGSRKPLL